MTKKDHNMQYSTTILGQVLQVLMYEFGNCYGCISITYTY